MQKTACNFLHVHCTTVHHDCTTVQMVQGADLNRCTAPHHTPYGGGAVVHLVQRRGAVREKRNLRISTRTRGRAANAQILRIQARTRETLGQPHIPGNDNRSTPGT